MQIKVLFVLLISVSFVTIYSSDLRDQDFTIPQELIDHQIQREILRTLGELDNLRLLKHRDDVLAIEFTRIEAVDMNMAPLVGRMDRQNDTFILNEIFHSNDDVNKILKDVPQVFINQPDYVIVRYIARSLDIGQSRIYTFHR